MVRRSLDTVELHFRAPTTHRRPTSSSSWSPWPSSSRRTTAGSSCRPFSNFFRMKPDVLKIRSVSSDRKLRLERGVNNQICPGTNFSYKSSPNIRKTVLAILLSITFKYILCVLIKQLWEKFYSTSSGQSYKASMIVNYDSRVVIWGIFKSGTTLES